jgi:NAD(P)-dependent dehydrogenase (short-subunit alcohol dehydrogenase family)
MLTSVLARELGSHNIRVNAIAPWIVETPITKAMRSEIGAKDITLSNVPLGRIGETDDIVGTALFLASDAAGWITGQTYSINGGEVMI